jgi:TIR domain
MSNKTPPSTETIEMIFTVEWKDEEWDISAPLDVSGDRLIRKIVGVAEFGISILNPSACRLALPEYQRYLQGSETLREAGVQAGDRVVLCSNAGLRVFLCHSSADKPFLRSLYGTLLKYEFKPWLDEYDILPGQDWRHTIEEAVHTSDAIIICLSCSSVNKEGFIQKEIKYALDAADEKPEGTIFLLPLRIEPCDVPPRLARWQWINYFETDGQRRLLTALNTRACTRPYIARSSL